MQIFSPTGQLIPPIDIITPWNSWDNEDANISSLHPVKADLQSWLSGVNEIITIYTELCSDPSRYSLVPELQESYLVKFLSWYHSEAPRRVRKLLMAMGSYWTQPGAGLIFATIYPLENYRTLPHAARVAYSQYDGLLKWCQRYCQSDNVVLRVLPVSHIVNWGALIPYEAEDTYPAGLAELDFLLLEQ